MTPVRYVVKLRGCLALTLPLSLRLHCAGVNTEFESLNFPVNLEIFKCGSIASIPKKLRQILDKTDHHNQSRADKPNKEECRNNIGSIMSKHVHSHYCMGLVALCKLHSPRPR